MSAHNVKGPGGKKPASAATNLIGTAADTFKTHWLRSADCVEQLAVGLA